MGNFQTKQNVFSRDGHKFNVREVLPDGRLIVSPWLQSEGWEGEINEYLSGESSIYLGSEMFAKAPTHIVDAEVDKARSELDSLRSMIDGSRSAVRDAERERKAVIERIAKAPKFERLLDFIEGKITHVVCSEYQHAAVIVPWDKFSAYRERNERDGGIKLLTLFGNTDGNTEWRLNQYRDGSGGWQTCHPCTSEDEALKVVGEWLEAAWAKFDPERPWFLTGAVNSADKYGFTVPEHIRAGCREHVIGNHRRTIEKMEADLAAAREKLAEVEQSA